MQVWIWLQSQIWDNEDDDLNSNAKIWYYEMNNKKIAQSMVDCEENKSYMQQENIKDTNQ